MISTGSQIRIGKTFGNLVSRLLLNLCYYLAQKLNRILQMVDLRMSNAKLRDRAKRVVRSVVSSASVLDVSREDVLDEVLSDCNGDVKLSILVATLGCTPSVGRLRLQDAGGSLKQALDTL